MNATPVSATTTPSAHMAYLPPPTIARFMRSTALFRGLMGPVGSGKSSACCVELLAKAFAQAPDADGLRKTRFAIVRNTYRELKDTTLRTWLAWFPEERFGPFGHSDMTHRLRLPHPDGQSRIQADVLFRALDRPQDARKLLSLELTGAWVNEARELPLSLIEALGDRVERYPSHREGGCSWAGVIMDTNPPDTDHWWHRLAEEERPEGWEFFRQPGGLLERGAAPGADDRGGASDPSNPSDVSDVSGRSGLSGPSGTLGTGGSSGAAEATGAADAPPPTRRFVPNPRAENLEHLPKDFYLRRMHGKSDQHVRIYYCGRYGFVQDGMPVYPEFDEARHVSDRELAPVEGLPLFIGLDFGLTPAAALAQRLPDGRWLFLDELVSQDMGIQRFAGLLSELLRRRYPDLSPEI